MNKETNEKLFDDYLLGRMDDEDVEKFEEKLAQNKELKRDFEFHKTMVNGIMNYELKNKFKQYDKEIPEPNLDFVKAKKYMAIAAAIIPFVFLAIWTFRDTGESKDLFAENFEAIPNTAIEFTRSDSIPEKFEHLSNKEYRAFYLAMKAYQTRNYMQTDSLITNNISQENLTAEIALYHGISQLATEKTSVSIDNLEFARMRGDEKIREHANWYLALAYIKEKDKNNALKFLKTCERGKLYKEKAAELINKVEREF